MRILTIIPVVLLCSACAYAPPIERKTPSSPNPTSYLFSSPFPKMLAAMDDLCSKDRPLSDADTPTSRNILYCHRTSEGYVYQYTPNFKPDADRDRIVIKTLNIDSRSYFVNGKPLRYSCMYAVILQRIDSNKTRVTIEPIELQTINGTTRGMHLGIVPNIITLRPTSIEEYDILLYLGKRTGESGMPPMQLPQP